MLIRKVPDNKSKALIAIAFAGCLTLLACSVNVKGHDGGDDKVDIQTPIGGLHVNEQADVRDTGLPIYPGARPKPKTGSDSKGANVNISTSFFGVKIVALEYESDDSPSKVLAFYQDQLKKYGHVIECHTTKHGGDLSVHAGDDSGAEREVSCGNNNSGNIVELKVGKEEDQHMVSVEPQGNGTDFALVYIQTRGREGSI